MAVRRELASRTGLQRVIGLATQTWALPALGRSEEARTLADPAVTRPASTAIRSGSASRLAATGGRTQTPTPPTPSRAFREALECAHRNHIAILEPSFAPDLARLEAVHGDLDDGLILFDEALDAAHRAGSHTQVGIALANLAFVFRDLGRTEIAATIYGSAPDQLRTRGPIATTRQRRAMTRLPGALGTGTPAPTVSSTAVRVSRGITRLPRLVVPEVRTSRSAVPAKRQRRASRSLHRV